MLRILGSTLCLWTAAAGLAGCKGDGGGDTGSVPGTSSGSASSTVGEPGTSSGTSSGDTTDATTAGSSTTGTTAIDTTGGTTVATTGAPIDDTTTGDATTGQGACALPGYALDGPYAVADQEMWGYDHNDPPLTAAGAGRHAIVYQTNVPHAIRWRLFDDVGAPVTDVVTEVPESLTWLPRPGIAIDEAGRLVVAWSDDGKLGPRVFVQRRAVDGAPVGMKIQVNVPPQFDAPPIDGRGVAVAMNAAGRFTVAWGENKADVITLYLRRYGVDGKPLAAPLVVDPQPVRLTLGPVSLAMDAAGGVLMTWADGWQTPGFRMQRFGPDGAPQTAVVTLPIPDVPLFYPPTAAMAPDGRAIIVYYLQDGHRVLGQRVDPAGALVGDAVQLNDSLADDAESSNGEKPHSANVAMADDGSFVVSWMTRLAAPRVQSIRRFDAEGAPLGPSTVLCAPEVFRGAPSLATAGGQIFVGSVAIEGDRERIYLSRLTPA